MKTVILDGCAADAAIGQRIRTALLNELAARNHDAQVFTLRDTKIGNCAGDFFCWVRSPGVCNTDDDNRVIAAAIVGAGLLIYLTPIAFGGYSATLTRAVDHQIQNMSPFFTMLNGETHHARRHDHYADFLVIGWQPAPNPARMDAADGLLLASPVYVDDLSGVVKTWIDRLAYLCHRPGCGGKCAYVVATVGGGPTGHTLRTMNGAMLTWGYHLAGQAGFKMGALATRDELRQHEAQVARSAEALFGAIRRQCALRPSFVSLLAFKIQQLAWQREGGTRMMSLTGARGAGSTPAARSTRRTLPAG